MGFFKKIKDLFSGNKKAKRPSMVSTPQQAPRPCPPPKQDTPRVKIEESKTIVKYDNRFSGLLIHPRSFSLLPNQIVYIESEYNEDVNNFIQKNYIAICTHFHKAGYDFCYLPYMCNTLYNAKYISYFAPNSTESDIRCIDSTYILSKLLNNISVKPTLLYYSKRYDRQYTNFPEHKHYRRILIDIEQASEDFSEILDAIKQDIIGPPSANDSCSSSSVRYSLCSDHMMYDYVQAEYPDMETRKLIEEIETRVVLLAQKGVGEHILQQIVAKPVTVSRMIITRDYRIILPDYNNMEIKMTPIVKAVYLLFLRHSSGIVFKHLSNYRTELVNIYAAIKGQPLDEKMMQSIYDATDPTKNSINEKVARIREAFVTRFDERLAKNYIIHGERGEAKRIPLHREFVEWQ